MPPTLLSCYSCPWPMGSDGSGAGPRTGNNFLNSVLFYFVAFISFRFVCIRLIRVNISFLTY